MLFSARFEERLQAAIQKLRVENLRAVPLNPKMPEGRYVARDVALISEAFAIREVDGQRLLRGFTGIGIRNAQRWQRPVNTMNESPFHDNVSHASNETMACTAS
jgi:hypothetical protein